MTDDRPVPPSPAHDDVRLEERRPGGGVVLVGLVLLGLVAVAGLAALLVVSPASFISLLPGWFTTSDPARSAAWLIAGVSTALAAILALRRERARPGRVVMITILVSVALVCAIYALATGAGPAPRPQGTCVAYSGGSHTCPGG